MNLESSSEIEIRYLESIQHQTYKNSTSEYIEINSRNMNKSGIKESLSK